MKLAMYKGPAEGFWNKLAHWAICIADTFRTGEIQRYSHIELVLEDPKVATLPVSYSSSFRDGGVRAKFINFKTGKWDLFEINGYDETTAIEWFFQHKDSKYDWNGIVRFLLPFVRQKKNKYFCSEAVAAMLGFSFPENLWPSDVLLMAVYRLPDYQTDFSANK